MALLQAVHAVRAIFIFACVTTINGANNIDCNFDDGTLCDWVQDKTDWFDWSTTGSGAPYSNPMSPGGGNVYAAMSPSLHLGSTSRIISPYINMTDGSIRCLSLYFNRYASLTGSLLVYQSDSTRSVKRQIMFSRGEHGYDWHYLDGEVRPTGNTRIVIEATKGIGTGDIAIDNVMLTPGYCPGSATIVQGTTTTTPRTTTVPTSTITTVGYHSPLDCSFDSVTLCGWRQGLVDDFDWELHSGWDNERYTGPSVDHTTRKDGHYLSIDASANKHNETATLIGQPFHMENNQRFCFTFWYHMYGREMGALKLYMGHSESKVKDTILWERQKNWGNFWKEAHVDITPPGPIVLMFEAIVGPGPDGDAAIDDIKIRPGACAGTHSGTFVG